MPITSTTDAQIRTRFGARGPVTPNNPLVPSPASVGGYLFARVACDSVAVQTLKPNLPAGTSIKAVYVTKAPTTAVTWKMDLPAVATPSLAAVAVVAALATSAVGSKTVTAGLLASYAVHRPITVQMAAGGGAGETIEFAIELMPAFDLGKESD